jgi:hypothetical protein
MENGPRRYSGLPTPVDGKESSGVADHRGIPGARAYAKHSGSPLDWPAKAIKAGVQGVSGGEAMIRFDNGSLRYLAVRESARVQGFPDGYEFPVPRSRGMGAIGNAVATPIATAIGRQMLSLVGPADAPRPLRGVKAAANGSRALIDNRQGVLFSIAALTKGSALIGSDGRSGR